MTSRYRLGIDIGGTFTDATLINENTGEIHVGKVPSTPEDPSVGFMNATDRMLREVAVSLDEVEYVVHGTTVATNAIIEKKVAPTGFITTDGFRDLLEIQRQIRPTLYDLHFEKPRPLVPRYLCFGIPERLDAQGQVLTPLDENALVEAVEQLKRENVTAVAVCFLHSYINPNHEKRVGEILHEVFPDAIVSLSSEVAPEFREYFRASTTVINACIRPIVARYLRHIEDRLREKGITAALLVMQSSGGVFTFASASEKPVFMVESGPAAGVIAATYLGTALGHPDVISFDMGGTTAKAGLVQNGAPRVTKEYEVGTAAQSGVGASRGAGYPIRTPVLDLVEIGAGGGSIAWVDSGGILRVGPQSAGADPGPVCYGKGGQEPTITDANLVLGRLNPSYFLGGEIELEVEAARKAVYEQCAQPLGMGIVETAHGIVEIANAAMTNALRLVSVQRGYDPRDFVLVAFGGAGPVHANRLAIEVQIPKTIIPMSPGTTSAMGLLVTDLKHDYSKTLIQRVDQADAEMVAKIYRELEVDGRANLEREGMNSEEITFMHQVDMRYVGQSYELTIPLPDGKLSAAEIEGVLSRFHREHHRAYGYSASNEPVEFVNLRLSAIGTINKPQLREIGAGDSPLSAAQKAIRFVYFAERECFVECPIYDRYRLSAGFVLEGPAIVEEIDATTVIHPGYQALVDGFGNLILTKTS